MFLRLLFVLLSALNIAVGAWLLLGQPYRHVRGPTDPGVPELQLLSDGPAAGSLSASAGGAAGRSAVASSSYSCMTLGPFETPQGLREARQALAPQVARLRARQQQNSGPSAWRVYLPAAASRPRALEQARQLGIHNIHDYFVVGSGDQANTVSLGLFRDPANARKRVNEVVAAGFPARMSESSNNEPEFWLDVAVAADVRLDWRKYVTAGGINSHSTSCF